MPTVDRFTSASPAVAGSRWRGWNTQEREVFWPLAVYGDPGQDWLDRDRALWASFHPAKTGAWRVTQPSGAARTLTLRFKTTAGTPWTWTQP